MRIVRHHAVLVLVCSMLAPALLAAAGGPASAAPGLERDSRNPTGWAWYTGVDAATLAGILGPGTLRITDIEIDSTAPTTFTAALVDNGGEHASNWWWYYDADLTDITGYLASNNARLIDLERYTDAGQTRYAAVMVDNTGTNARAWWWWVGKSVSWLKAFAVNNNARIIDLDRNADGTFNAVFVKNIGVEKKPWWFYAYKTTSQVLDLMKSNKARLYDVEYVGNGSWAVVMVARSDSGSYWWYLNSTESYVGDRADQNGARIYDIERYTNTENQVRYAVLLADNSDALTRKVRETMRPAGDYGGAWGFYLKPVNEPVLAALRPDKVFEPASTIKVIILLYAMQQVDLGSEDLDLTNVIWFANQNNPARYPMSMNYATDKNICPYDNLGNFDGSTSYADPLRTLLQLMMQQSDNRTTDALRDRYGIASINNNAAAIGMESTQMIHRIGCPAASSSPYAPNETTLDDLSALYEQVANNDLFDVSLQDDFYGVMLTNPSGRKALVDAEAAKLGLSQKKANQFLANMQTATKGGSYDTCAPTGCTSSPTTMVRAQFGHLALPFKDRGGSIVLHDYVYGRFLDGTVIPCTWNSTQANTCSQWTAVTKAYNDADTELLRGEINRALQTW